MGAGHRRRHLRLFRCGTLVAHRRARARYCGEPLLQLHGNKVYLMLVRSRSLHDLGQDGINVLRNGHEYSRGSNPTRNGFEAQLTALEAGHAGFAFASGIAAEDALLRAVLAPGDHIVLGADGYGGTNRLVNRLYGRRGITSTPVDITDLAAVAASVQPGKTTLLWVETPSTPLLGIADVADWAAVAHAAGVLLLVDNTFATPTCSAS